MQVDAADVAKIITAFGSFGGGFAFLKPFAERFFASWLGRAEKREAAEAARAAAALEKERALERIAVLHERTVGVLENVERRLDRLDARQDRIEAHLGISITPSAIPSPPPPAPTRRQLTDPDLRAAAGPTPAAPSGRVSEPA